MSNSNQWRVRQPRQGEAAGIEIYAGIKYVCQMSRHPGEQDMAQANARRIVACVNAMAGIPDDNILFAQDGSVRVALAELKQQRDALLAALEQCAASMKGDKLYVNTLAYAQRAIAATNGGAKTLEDLQQLSSERQMSPECAARIIEARKPKGGAQ